MGNLEEQYDANNIAVPEETNVENIGTLEEIKREIHELKARLANNPADPDASNWMARIEELLEALKSQEKDDEIPGRKK